MLISNNKVNKDESPILVVVMGVSGCGKSTLAREISNHLNCEFLDADTFHSEEAIKQMSQGIALTDEQRTPWIARIFDQLSLLGAQNKSCVLAYSGLKRKHRKVIFDSYLDAIGILLNVDQVLIAQRLQTRKEHFMSSQLLASQIAAMEPINAQPKENIKLLTLGGVETVEHLLMKSIDFIVS